MNTCAHGFAWDQACTMCGRMASMTIFPLGPAGAAPIGCICPPTAEQTCENPMCPRQNPLKRLAAGNDLNRPQPT